MSTRIVPAPPPLLSVSDLRVSLPDGAAIVENISFAVAPGEIVGLVGESGSGKTTIANALLGHARRGAHISGGEVRLAGRDVLTLDPAALRAIRGPVIAYAAQDPATALDPSMRIGAQIDEVLRCHRPDLGRADRRARIAAVAADVGLVVSADFLALFPHQLSGGQQQRVLLALSLVLSPQILVLDEPTTALDVTTQAHVLATVRRLCRDQGIAAVYVSHDLAVVRELADQLVVLYGGRIAETARRDAVFGRPHHPYTRGLLAAIPDIAARRSLVAIPGHAPAPADRPEGCAFAPRCASASQQCLQPPPLRPIEPEHLTACHHPVRAPFLAADISSPAVVDPVRQSLLTVRDVTAHYGAAQVLHDVDLDLERGACTALVGESGSGKTTLARAIIGLGSASGTMVFDGERIALGDGKRDITLRRRIQYVFQNPYRALNPRQTVGATLRTAARHFFSISAFEATRRVAEVLERVALPPGTIDRYPRDLSGGERQRVAIARALICDPELLICDEITSALDVSVQAAILNLLAGLRREGLTMLFVTHDLAVVRAVADRVVVLRNGRVVEQGEADVVLDRPADTYTRSLIADSPRLLQAAAVQPLQLV